MDEKGIELFWSKVAKGAADQCWDWQGTRLKRGYGTFNWRHWQGLAHRFAWELANGPIPEEAWQQRMVVAHSCDRPCCVNPAHLRLATQAENIQEAESKGRMEPTRMALRGNRHPFARLTAADAIAIKAALAEGVTKAALARQYGVVFNTIKAVESGKTWGRAEESPTERTAPPRERRTGTRHGTASNFAKLSERDVPGIRKMFADGHEQKEIAALYGISQSAVSFIVNRKRWSHIP